MATTVTQGFAKLRSTLEITDLQTETVSTRQSLVRKAAEAEMRVVDSFLTGSYSRSTLISPLSRADVDIFVVLDPIYYELNGQARLLDRVKRVLKQTYPNTPNISRNGQAVTIEFSDFLVDVVPGFNRSGGGYLIPNSQGASWIETDPKKHISISSQSNYAHDQMLVPLVKMLKCWNRTINRFFRSFHLEVLAWEIFEGLTFSTYSSAVRYFFDKGRERITKRNPDPAGYGGDVGYYITQANSTDAVSRFTTAYERAIRAEQYESQGKILDATNEWRKVFDVFPIYG